MTVQLNKPRHFSVVPLRCVNQSCSYYERNKDLDLDSPKLVVLNLVGVIRRFASEKVDNLRVPS
jgi:hypothetical protein